MTSPSSRFAQALAKFPPQVQTLLQGALAQSSVIPGNTVYAMMQSMGVSLPQLMVALLNLAASYAVVPVSHYPVGAVAAGMPNQFPMPNLYFGANVEFTGPALSFTVHAEQSATTNAWLNGEAGMQLLAISAAPCGYCRQFLYELVTAQQLQIVLPVPNNPNPQIQPLTYFIPDAFGPSDLGLTGGLMQPQSNGLSFSATDPVILAALDAANNCYAPYPTPGTQNFAGVALLGANGGIYPGRYAENAAYNPSMSPFESAVTFMNMCQPAGSALSITRAVLMEVPTYGSQLSATTAVLSAFAPGVALEYYPL